jgi:hypothetical protein
MAENALNKSGRYPVSAFLVRVSARLQDLQSEADFDLLLLV